MFVITYIKIVASVETSLNLLLGRTSEVWRNLAITSQEACECLFFSLSDKNSNLDGKFRFSPIYSFPRQFEDFNQGCVKISSPYL